MRYSNSIGNDQSCVQDSVLHIAKRIRLLEEEEDRKL